MGGKKLVQKNSYKIWWITKMKYFCSPKIKGKIGRPVRLGVRTPGFHPGSRGSNPLRAT